MTCHGNILLTCRCLRFLLLPSFNPCRRRVPAPTHATLVGFVAPLVVLAHKLPASGTSRRHMHTQQACFTRTDTCSALTTSPKPDPSSDGLYCMPLCLDRFRFPWDLDASFGQDNGLGGAPGDKYCVLACEQVRGSEAKGQG